MTPDSRLAAIVAAMERVGLTCLVMGGHAVRYYGLARNTNDFDLHLAPEAWESLLERLVSSGLSAEPVIEGPSWRPQTFRRFLIGRLPDGREEWLEFWRENHLLPPFSDLYARRELGNYGGRDLPFLALPDLIHSKETERDGDWRDVAVLEEFLDARLLARALARDSLIAALAQLRSRKGFESHLQRGSFSNVAAIREALSQVRASISQAFLLPLAADATIDHAGPAIEPLIAQKLRTIQPGSSMHFLLVEAVRRQYKVAAQAADRADKESIRATQTDPPARL